MRYIIDNIVDNPILEHVRIEDVLEFDDASIKHVNVCPYTVGAYIPNKIADKLIIHAANLEGDDIEKVKDHLKHIGELEELKEVAHLSDDWNWGVKHVVKNKNNVFTQSDMDYVVHVRNRDNAKG